MCPVVPGRLRGDDSACDAPGYRNLQTLPGTHSVGLVCRARHGFAPRVSLRAFKVDRFRLIEYEAVGFVFVFKTPELQACHGRCLPSHFDRTGC